MTQPILRTERAQFLVECLDLPAATGVDDARWEAFQLDHLNDNSTFRIEDKARQIAWSWLSAAEAVAEAVLNAQGSIFVSINLDEAKEKIRYARVVLENLQVGGLPRLVRDNELALEFGNGARLISHPATPPRGKARMNLYLDEFAHVRDDRRIYTAGLPVLSKGGWLRIGSSPLGASGVFWEIFSQSLRPYPGYTRKKTPWWEVQAFCRNVAEARKLAPAMDTADRVELFGNDRIKAIFANILLEDFQQEYEGEFVDESTAWITWEEIKANQNPPPECILAEGRGKAIDKALLAIETLANLVRTGEIEPVLAAGFDVGRTRNASELAIVGLTTTRQYPLRALLTLNQVEFDDQLDVLAAAMVKLPIVKLQIDQNGIGRNLAENLAKRFPAKAAGVNFTTESKLLWATDAKMLAQQKRTPLPVSRDLAYQIHSIKRTVTPSKNLVFDVQRNEKHHADKFWAWALALSSATSRRYDKPGTAKYA